MSAHIECTAEVNKTTCEVKEGTDANNEASVEDNRETSKDKEEGLVNKVGGQLNSSKEIQHLQEGMKNMDVQECQGSNDERGDDDDGSTDNELLGSVHKLSNVDDEDERLLGSNSKLNAAEGDNSSSGASAFYGFDEDGNAVDEIGQESAHNIEDHQENNDYGEVMNDNASQIPSEACSENPNAQEIQQSDLYENVGDMETHRKLPSFTSTFMKVKGVSKETSAVSCANTLQQNTPVVQMTTVIHPPRTNAEMQMVMKGRLPSTSGSEADVPEVAEQVMMSRMASTQSSSMPSNTQLRIQASQVFHQQQPVQQSGALMSQSSAFSGSQPKATVLKAKDQNVMKNIIHGPPKWKPIGGPQGDTQMLSSPTVPEEEPEEPHRDIEGDPFYSSVH